MNNKIIFLLFFSFINCQDIKTTKLKSKYFDKLKISKEVITQDNSIIFCGSNLNKLELLKLNPNYEIDLDFADNGKLTIPLIETGKLVLNEFIETEYEDLLISGISYFKNQTKAVLFKIKKNGILDFISIMPIDNLKSVNILSQKNNKYFLTIFSNTLSVIQLDKYAEEDKEFNKIEFSDFFKFIIEPINNEYLFFYYKNPNSTFIKYDSKFNIKEKIDLKYLVSPQDLYHFKISYQNNKFIIGNKYRLWE